MSCPAWRGRQSPTDRLASAACGVTAGRRIYVAGGTEARLGGAVVAQSDEGTGPVTHFIGTRLSVVPDTTDEEWWVEDGIGHARVFRPAETVEWSDPRLPSKKQNVANFDMYNVGEFRELPMAGTTLLEGPDGYWSGEFMTYCDADGACYGMSAVTGHGTHL